MKGGGGTGTDGGGGIGALTYATSTGKLVSGAVYNGATATFGSYSLTNSGLNDVAILELDPADGTVTNAIRYGASGNDFIMAACYDASTSDVFFGGNYEQTITLPGAGSMTSSSTSTSSLLATRYSTSGHTFVWGKSGIMSTGSGTGVNNAFRSVAATGNGTVYFGGSFNASTTVVLTLSGTTVLTGSGNVDMALVRYNVDNGDLEYAASAGGTGGSEIPFGIALNANGVLGIGGQNSSTLTLGSLPSISTAGTLDIIMAFQSVGAVTTSSPASVTNVSAIMAGNVISDGGATVTDRGIVYGTSSLPTTSSNKISIGTGTGAFSQSVSGLSASTTYYVRSFLVNGFGTFYGSQVSFTTASSALPLTLLSFKAFQAGENVQVEWKTAMEDNVQQFELEKSPDGIAFEKLAIIKATNTRSGNYSWLGKPPYNGNNFFRLRMIDQDGSFTYSSVARINIDNAMASVRIFPTVITNGSCILETGKMEKGKYQLNLYNANGDRVHSQEILHNGSAGSQSISLPANLAPGTYITRLTKGTTVFTGKLIVQ